MHYDYFIIGQGLAGSCVSHALLRRGKTVLVFNDPERASSSLAAAGMFNPITGRHWVKSWKYDLLYEAAVDFYRKVEKEWAHRFFYEMEIYRPFDTQDDLGLWLSRRNDREYAKILKEICEKPVFEGVIHNPIGGLRLDQGGYLDVVEFINTASDVFEKSGILRNESFDYSFIDKDKEEGGHYRYKGDSARKIIFCDGVPSSGIWAFLPFRPVKGELLMIESAAQLEVIVNKGVFIMPRGNRRFRVGSTFDFKDITTEPTEKGRSQLTDKLNQLLLVPYTIVDHWAGIRPATVDRRPFIGHHPDDENLLIFNGLGTKGVSLAPFLSGILADHLENGAELPKEVDIKRFIG